MAPENIDELYDTLDDPTDANATMAKLGPLESGWLARHIQITIEKENEAAGEQIEQELQVYSDAIYALVTINPCLARNLFRHETFEISELLSRKMHAPGGDLRIV